MIRWKLDPLKPNPFSWVQRALKFSAVFGVTSSKSLKITRPFFWPQLMLKKTFALDIIIIQIQLLDQRFEMNSQQPQSCTKCGCMPQDILMLACGHDLCLNCASDRLAFQMKKNKNANVIVCQQCHEKTPLDAESVDVLKSMIKTPVTATNNGRSYAETTPNSNLDSKYTGAGRNEPTGSKYNYNKTSSIGIDRGIDRSSLDRTGNGNKVGASKISNTEYFQGIPSKKSCTEHPQEQILYFCFDCKCECICPECVIHGKHKDHDVKTVRKSQPIVKSQIDGYLDRFQGNVQALLIKKSQVEKQIRGLNEQNNVSKRQIQQAFQDLRAKINSQEKELLTRCDHALEQNLSELQKISMSITQRVQQLKSSSATMHESLKKDQILLLNFYSRKWRQLQQDSKQPEIYIPNIQVASNEAYLSQILDVNDQVGRIGAVQRAGRVYNQG